MREIKFRGRSLRMKGHWVYGYYSKSGRNESHIETLIEHAYIIVDPETVGQYTGLKDKNGVEIYEGSILKWKGYEVENGKQIRPERIFEVKWDFLTLYRLRNIHENHIEIEVIGNIYENKELLNDRI